MAIVEAMVVQQSNDALTTRMSAQNLSTDEAVPPSTRLDVFAWLVSNRITHQLAIWGGRFLPLLLVAEHPRSGGTWLSHMLADYLQIPFPKYLRRPTSFEAVVHSHLPYSPRLRRAVFVKRDGRDVVVSTYFKVLKSLHARNADNAISSKVLRRYPSFAGATGELEDTRARLPRFITEWWRRPPGCRINWEDYSKAWINNDGNVVVTSYETLRGNCESELSRIIGSISPRPIDQSRLAAIVAKYSFEAQTGRRPGNEDSQSNKRKGIIGDWRNYFTAEAAKEFNRLGGRALIALDYEADDSWVSTSCSRI